MAIDFQDSTPLYVQIIKDIKKKIGDNELVSGQQLKSHKELAQEYDVSLITIKSALSSLIDEGYLFSRVGKGTFVAEKRIKNDLSSHDSIGLVLRDLKNPFFSLIAQMVEETAYSKNYNILLSNSSSQIKKEEAQIKNFQKMGVKGIIIASIRKEPHAPPVLRKLAEKQFPFVMVSYVADKDIYYVGADHELGAYKGTEHLLKLGHKKIGYINTPESNILGEVRLSGFKKALNDYQVPLKEEFLLRLSMDTHPESYKAGYSLGDHFHNMPEKPTAFFVYDDVAALGFMKRVMELGYNIPEDLAIVGFDDIDRAKYESVPLTTLHQPVEEIGTLAIEKLIDLIDGKHPEVRTILTPTLVVRESCGAMASQELMESDKRK